MQYVAKSVHFFYKYLPHTTKISFKSHDKKVSPPFEGGVVGRIDYLIYIVFSFPTGVVDS
jgi:hypothetical protein